MFHTSYTWHQLFGSSASCYYQHISSQLITRWSVVLVPDLSTETSGSLGIDERSRVRQNTHPVSYRSHIPSLRKLLQLRI